MNLVLDPTTWDLAIVNGQFVLAEEMDCLEQKIKTRLLLIRGEYYLDPSKGIPYFEDIFIKNPDLGIVQAHFVSTILDTPKVTGISNLVARFDRASRTYYLNFVVQVGTVEVQISEMEVVL